MQKLLALFLVVSLDAAAEWRQAGPGVEYNTYSFDPPYTFHVARIDMTNTAIRTFVSDESDRCLTVSEFADRYDTILAVNGDYFDGNRLPLGLTVGRCGEWEARAAESKLRESAVAVGRRRVDIVMPSELENGVPDWVEGLVSGWPILVREGRALSSSEILGSDSFARSRHLRTAAGASADGRTLFLVVVDGNRDGQLGITLPELARFMRDTLGVFEAVNLDGGGSTAMSINQKRVSDTKGPEERYVANHIGVVAEGRYPACGSER